MRKHLRLPKRPSNLLRVALRDFQKAKRQPEITINMSVWHGPQYRPLSQYAGLGGPLQEFAGCAVCLAGAVMYCQGATSARPLTPDDYPEPVRGQLYAINYLRCGYVYQAFTVLERPWPMDLTPRVSVEEYQNDNPRPFYRSMHRLIKRLAKAGH